MPLPPSQAEALFARFGGEREKALRAYDPEGKGDKGEMGRPADQRPGDGRAGAPAGAPDFGGRPADVGLSLLLRRIVAAARHARRPPRGPRSRSRSRRCVRSTRAPRRAEDQALADAMSAYWAAFARSGDPNGNGRPRWPAYTAKTDVVMDFGVGGPVAGPDPRKGRLDLVEALATAPAPPRP